MKAWILIAAAMLVMAPAAAQVSVKGYYRKDGTYVAPHIRSEANSTKADNYGPSSTSPLYSGKGSVTPPSTRDADRNGSANRFSSDDDSDTVHDDRDRSQYGSKPFKY